MYAIISLYIHCVVNCKQKSRKRSAASVEKINPQLMQLHERIKKKNRIKHLTCVYEMSDIEDEYNYNNNNNNKSIKVNTAMRSSMGPGSI